MCSPHKMNKFSENVHVFEYNSFYYTATKMFSQYMTDSLTLNNK